nr:hypothetical protein [Tanacetum cinerariifolium]
MRIKKLERLNKSRTHRLKRLYKVGLSAKVESSKDEGLSEEDASKKERIFDIDANEDIYLVNVHNDEDMFDAYQDLGGEEVFVAQQDENVVEKEVDVSQVQVTTITTTSTISIDEVALAQALAELQVEEQQKLNDEEKETLFMQLLEKRRKFFAAKRAKEKRNKPPTQAQQRKIMCTYLKNMEGKKLTDLKNKSFDSIQKMFDRAFKKVNIFVDYRAELVEESFKKAEAKVMVQESSKRAGTELEQENEEGVAIEAIPLAFKPRSIVDWKIQKGGMKSYYKIIRADGSSKIYLIFSHMLKDFDREDMENLWKLVKAKYGSTRSEGDYKRVLWGDLKVMFDPHVEDEV